jgi:hypothetical protein
MDYPLENLGPERFQQLCQALLTKEYPGVSCLPVAQPDGGRDALRFRSEKADREFVVFQVKFSRSAREGDDARKWVLKIADDEKPKVERLIDRGARRYVLITNVSGTAHLDSGSIDQMQEKLRKEFNTPVTCWWRDDINRRLDGNWDIKLRYPEVLSGQDFFRLLFETSSGRKTERQLNALRAFLADQYVEDVEVKFKQVELQNKLLDLFVDLPFRVLIRSKRGQIERFASSIRFRTSFSAGNVPGTYILYNSYDDPLLQRHEELLKDGTATLLLSDFGDDGLHQIVVEGAPGQGKSTLSHLPIRLEQVGLR